MDVDEFYHKHTTRDPYLVFQIAFYDTLERLGTYDKKPKSESKSSKCTDKFVAENDEE